MYQKLICLAMMSCSRICIVPVQDWLGLDNRARMNVPGTVDANWRWRLAPGLLTEQLREEMLAVTKRYGRVNWNAIHELVAEA